MQQETYSNCVTEDIHNVCDGINEAAGWHEDIQYLYDGIYGIDGVYH